MPIGKMFGVLIVKNSAKQLGYLAAFSGKLGGKNHHPFFVPPVFDTLDQNGFYKKGELILNKLNDEIKTLENQPEIKELNEKILNHSSETKKTITAIKLKIKQNKKERAQKRQVSTF